MPGASQQTRRGQDAERELGRWPDGGDGGFEPVAISQADTVLLWDAAGRTLIAANAVGRMPWT